MSGVQAKRAKPIPTMQVQNADKAGRHTTISLPPAGAADRTNSPRHWRSNLVEPAARTNGVMRKAVMRLRCLRKTWNRKPWKVKL
jgi:hypothetical protein